MRNVRAQLFFGGPRRNPVSAASKRTAVVWAGIVAGMMLLVVAMGLRTGQRPAGAQPEDSLRGPALQFGCDVAEVGALDPIFDP